MVDKMKQTGALNTSQSRGSMTIGTALATLVMVFIPHDSNLIILGPALATFFNWVLPASPPWKKS